MNRLMGSPLAMMAILLALVLAGCGGSGSDDVQQWMTLQKNQSRPRLTPIAEPRQFQPQAYLAQLTVDPFSRQQLSQALRRDSAQAAGANLLAPELTRRKEALESVPLDAMALVGTLMQAGRPVALVRVDRMLYPVRLGNYLGQNYGRVMRITDSELVLRELVQDAAGDWVERTAALQLQEKTK
jgi:type IV pilus assembly protein PilP